VERRCATDAIRLHDPDFKRTPKNILFPGNKKVRFLNFSQSRGVRHEFHELTRIEGDGFDINRRNRRERREFLINLRAGLLSRRNI
jgi:hypothetical protein